MFYNKRSVITALAVLFLFNLNMVQAATGTKAPVGPKWYTSHDKALKAAEKSGKPILMLFTGSDWCKYCIMLQKEVFETKEFKSWAKSEIILLELDFPINKKLSKEIEDQNRKLDAQYQIGGRFPTILILDSAGKEIGRTGYVAGMGKEWLEFIKSGVAEYYQFRFVVPGVSFVKAMADANVSEHMLLVIKEDANSGKYLPELLSDNGFVTFAGSGVEVVVQSPKASNEDTEAYKGFSKLHGLSEAKVVLVDVKKGKVLYKSNDLPPVASLVEQLTNGLPQIGYDGQWLENYDKAKIIAAQQKKSILLNFTGSDWCKWCKKMEKEVMGQKEFEDFARQNLVLVKVDFPRQRSMPARVKEQNRRLEKRYDRKGFPNVVVTDSSGKELGRLKYRQEGLVGFMTKMKEFIGNAEAQGGK